MIQEHEEPYIKTLFVDNLAATGFFSDGHANWRTRHLRLRAQHVPWRITTLDWRVRHIPGVIMIADLGTKPLPIQRTLELKELMSMILQKKVEEERKLKEDGPEAARKEKNEEKEDGPEAARKEKNEEKEEGPEAVSEEKDEKKGKEGGMFHVAANQVRLAVIMALIAKSRAQGQNDRPDQPEEGPLKVIVIGYTLLVIFITLFLKQFIAWLRTPQVPGGDHAAGMPQPPPIQGPPGSTSSEPSQGSSITVDWQGREVNRPCARANGKRKGKGQGKGEGQPEDFDWAYGPARPMTPEERSQFGLQNREWLLRWFASLSPEERTQAGLDQPLLNSGSSNPTSQSDSTLAGIQEEPEQEVPAGDPTVPVHQAPPVEPEIHEEETLHHPSERDYRDIMMDEAWEPTPDPPRHGPSAAGTKSRPNRLSGPRSSSK